ncbi:hypothetical protein TRVL_00595 [Trypanosoma vivax]|nr:hypothetical protein TRVL_00595 [Trypanosoma vivax]
MLLPAHQAEFRFRNHEKVFSLGGFNMNTPNVSPFVDIGARRCILQVERRAARVLSKPYLVTALKRKVSRRFQLLTPLHCFMTKVPVHTLRAPASSGSHSGRTIMVDTLVNGSLEVPIEFGTISSSNGGEGDASNVGAKQWFVDITSICSHASAFLMDSETGELLPPQKQQSQSDHMVERGPGANTSGTRRIVVLDTPRRQYRLVAVLLRGAAKRKPERPANFSKTKAVKRN